MKGGVSLAFCICCLARVWEKKMGGFFHILYVQYEFNHSSHHHLGCLGSFIGHTRYLRALLYTDTFVMR